MVPKLVPSNGSKNGPSISFFAACSPKFGFVFRPRSGVRFLFQVAIYWQWLKHLERKSSSDRPLLLLNLDETCMSCPARAPVGVVASKARGWSMPGAAQGMKRGSATFVAVLCENKEIQKSVPSFLLCNKHFLPEKLCRDLQASAPASLHIWRLASSWNTSTVMCQILDTIAAALAPWQAFCQPTLIMDVAPCHICHSVLERARSLQVFVAFIPTYLTSKLQVADLFCFRSFKAWWGREIQKLRAGHHEVTKASWFQLFSEAPAWLQARDWSQSFDATCALHGNINSLTKDLQALALDPAGPESMPTQLQISCLWPRKYCSKKTYSLLLTPNLE